MINKTKQGTYRVRVKHRGRVVADRTFKTLKQARKWEGIQNGLLDDSGVVDPAKGKVLLCEIAEEWLPIRRTQVQARTYQSDESNWENHLRDSFGARPVGLISRRDVEAFAARLSQSGRAPGTVNRVVASLSQLLNYAVEGRYIRMNVARAVRVVDSSGKRSGAAREMTVLTRQELADVVGRQRERSTFAEVTEFLALTGLRWGEVAGLRVGDRKVSPSGTAHLLIQRTVIYRNGSGKASVKAGTKSGRRRVVPLTPRAESIYRAWADARPAGEPLFRGERGGLLHPSNFRREVAWAQTCPVRIHDLRHTYATFLIASGADVKAVQSLLGHASATTTLDLYGHLLGSDALDAATERLAGFLGDDTGTNGKAVPDLGLAS